MKTFEEVWEETGYQYGEDALENVKLGWELAFKEIQKIASNQLVNIEFRKFLANQRSLNEQ